MTKAKEKNQDKDVCELIIQQVYSVSFRALKSPKDYFASKVFCCQHALEEFCKYSSIVYLLTHGLLADMVTLRT